LPPSAATDHGDKTTNHSDGYQVDFVRKCRKKKRRAMPASLAKIVYLHSEWYSDTTLNVEVSYSIHINVCRAVSIVMNSSL